MYNWNEVEPLIQVIHTTAAVLGVYVTLSGIRLNWVMHNRINRQNSLNTLMIALSQFRRQIAGGKPDVNSFQAACEELYPAIQVSLGHLPPEFRREFDAMLTHTRLWLDLRNEEHRVKSTLLPAKDQLVGITQRLDRLSQMCTYELMHIANYRPNLLWFGGAKSSPGRPQPEPLWPEHRSVVGGSYFDSSQHN